MSRSAVSLRAVALSTLPRPSSFRLGSVRHMATVAAKMQRESQNHPAPLKNVNQTARHDGNRVLQEAVAAERPRHDWTREEISAIYYQPLMELAYQAVDHSSKECT